MPTLAANQRILIAHRNEQVCTELINAFDETARQIEVAHNGREALIKSVNQYEDGMPFNFICLDQQLPILSGLEVINMLRKYEDDNNMVRRSYACLLMPDAHMVETADCRDAHTIIMEAPADLAKIVRLARACHHSSVNQQATNILHRQRLAAGVLYI
jgi:CheY-like chemotaxis protein